METKAIRHITSELLISFDRLIQLTHVPYPPPLLRGEDISFDPKTIGNIKASNAQLGCQEF